MYPKGFIICTNLGHTNINLVKFKNDQDISRKIKLVGLFSLLGQQVGQWWHWPRICSALHRYEWQVEGDGESENENKDNISTKWNCWNNKNAYCF